MGLPNGVSLSGVKGLYHLNECLNWPKALNICNIRINTFIIGLFPFFQPFNHGLVFQSSLQPVPGYSHFQLASFVGRLCWRLETQPYRANTSVGRYLPPRRAKGSASNITTSYCLPPVLPTGLTCFLRVISASYG